MSTVATTNLKNASSVSNNIVLNSNGTTTISSLANLNGGPLAGMRNRITTTNGTDTFDAGTINLLLEG